MLQFCWRMCLQRTALQVIPFSGSQDAAFRHYSGPVGKPTYERALGLARHDKVQGLQAEDLSVKPEDAKLFADRPASYQARSPA